MIFVFHFSVNYSLSYFFLGYHSFLANFLEASYIMEIAISLIDVFAMLSSVFAFCGMFCHTEFCFILCRHVSQSFMAFVFWVMVIKAFPIWVYKPSIYFLSTFMDLFSHLSLWSIWHLLWYEMGCKSSLFFFSRRRKIVPMPLSKLLIFLTQVHHILNSHIYWDAFLDFLVYSTGLSLSLSSASQF